MASESPPMLRPPDEPQFWTIDEVIAKAEERPSWLIEGILSVYPTLLFAQPKAGKTYLAVNMMCALANGDESFLGQAVTTTRSVGSAYIALDPGSGVEVAKRAKALLNDPLLPPVIVECLPPDWARFADECVRRGIEFVTIDNLTRACPKAEDLNQPGAIRELTDGIDVLTRAGITTLTIHHDNRSGSGYAGTYASAAYFRQLLHLTGSPGCDQNLLVSGNNLREDEIGLRLEMLSEDAGRYVRRGRKSDAVIAEGEAAPRPGRRQARAANSDARKREQAELLKAAGPFDSVAAAGRRLPELDKDVSARNGRMRVYALLDQGYLTRADIGL